VNTIAASAADEIGPVSTRPKTIAMTRPAGTGWKVVAISMKRCSAPITWLMPGDSQLAIRPPDTSVTTGTTMMSTLVFPVTRLPSSAPTTAEKYAPTGPPPARLYPSAPAPAADSMASVDTLKALAMATPTVAPTMGLDAATIAL